MSESMQEQIAAAIELACYTNHPIINEADVTELCPACNDAAAIARAFEPAVETVTLADDLLPFVYTDAHGAQESMGALGDPLDPWPKRWVVIVLDDDDPRLSGKIGADGYLAAVPPSEHPTVDERSCPTCTGQVRETVGLVCQTCGTDYGLDERDRLAGVMHGDSYEGLDPLARAEVDAALAAPPAPHGDSGLRGIALDATRSAYHDDPEVLSASLTRVANALVQHIAAHPEVDA